MGKNVRIYPTSLSGARKVPTKNEPWVRLAGAILREAVEDYLHFMLQKNIRGIKSLEGFFLSDYGQMLSFNQGEYIIEKCRIIAEHEMENEIIKQRRYYRCLK